ncbi:MAG: hypothetical protein GC181_12675 [Bacteroidetes bacterium]|nr:hypothetical protein [Bacteroidota bacterium]
MRTFWAFTLLSIAACGSHKVVQNANWQSNAVSIDANDKEYGNISFYNTETKTHYSISNDSANLYLCLAFSDENLQRQIMLAGLTLWIDTLPKPLKQIGVTYPLKTERKQGKHGTGDEPTPDKIHRDFILTHQVAELTGFRNLPNGFSPLTTKEGLNLKMDWDSSQTLIYELQIPLKNWYHELTSSDSSHIFTATVVVNTVKPPGSGNGDHTGGGSGGGNFPGSQPTSNNQMDMRPNVSFVNEEHSFRVNFKLNHHATTQ